MIVKSIGVNSRWIQPGLVALGVCGVVLGGWGWHKRGTRVGEYPNI